MQERHAATIDKWFQHWEIWITAGFIILTLLLGCMGNPVFDFFQSIVIALLEFAFGMAIFLVRKVSLELDGFRQVLSDSSKLMRHTEKLKDLDSLDLILRIMSSLIEAMGNPLLYSILKKELEMKALEFNQMASSEDFDMWKPGDYTPIQHKLQNYMEILTEGCGYVTVSNLRFWSGREISNPSDFLRFNLDCTSKRRVIIERIFLLNKTFDELTEQELRMFREHLHATQGSKGRIKTYVVESDKDQAVDAREYGNFSVWLSKGWVPQLLLNMVYNAKTGDFERLEVTRQQRRIQMYYKRFTDLKDQSEEIGVYLCKHGAA